MTKINLTHDQEIGTFIEKHQPPMSYLIFYLFCNMRTRIRQNIKYLHDFDLMKNIEIGYLN